MRKAIQVLVVVVILLSCGGLFLLFVGKVREAAVRVQCTNNLKQLGLAIENYAGTYSKYPRAALPNAELVPEERQSWIVEIWPFVEAGPIYNKMDHKKAWDAEENRFAALTIVRTLRCPTYRDPPPAGVLFPSHYLGIAGVGANAIDLPLEDNRAGFFGYDRTIKHEDLKDTRSILVLAETSQVSGAWTAAGLPTSRGFIPNGSAYIGKDGQFGGNHRGGANVTFADGSVHFIEQSIDPAVWEAMATLSGKGNGE
jgi:prepilin-type processing-associated H-X9-DG protein